MGKTINFDYEGQNKSSEGWIEEVRELALVGNKYHVLFWKENKKI